MDLQRETCCGLLLWAVAGQRCISHDASPLQNFACLVPPVMLYYKK